MGYERLITICAMLLCGYYGGLVAVCLVILQRERRLLYKILSGGAPDKGGACGRKPLADRLTELKKKWRAPAEGGRKEADR